MIKTFCDRCENEAKPSRRLTIDLDGHTGDHDLCDECRVDFYKFFINNVMCPPRTKNAVERP